MLNVSLVRFFFFLSHLTVPSDPTSVTSPAWMLSARGCRLYKHDIKLGRFFFWEGRRGSEAWVYVEFEEGRVCVVLFGRDSKAVLLFFDLIFFSGRRKCLKLDWRSRLS